jgi:hypothetical protein
MKGVVILNVVLSLIELSLYMVNMTFILQNLIFTHDSLTTSDIPFYDSSLGETTTRWYRYHWWEYASDSLRIIPTLLAYMAIIIGVHFKIKYVGFYVGMTSLLLTLEILKSFKRAVDYVRCGSFQLCRNYDVGTNEIPSSANAVFVASAFFTFTFAILHAIRLGVFSYIESSIQEYIETWYQLKQKRIEEAQQIEDEEIERVVESHQRKYLQNKPKRPEKFTLDLEYYNASAAKKKRGRSSSRPRS